MNKMNEYDHIAFSKKVEEYKNIISQDLLNNYPELSNIIQFSIGGSREDLKIIWAEGQIRSENVYFKETPYYYQSEKSEIQLLHFTSLQATLLILESQILKLKSLNGVNDPNEISYAADVFNCMSSNQSAPFEFIS
jgi:hypothetical protein